MKYGYKKMYINGQMVDAIDGLKHTIICPGNEEQIAELAWAGKADAQFALNSAQKGFKMWKKLSIAERNAWILKLRDAIVLKEELLRESIMDEMGKPYPDTAEDFQIIDALAFYPQLMQHRFDTIIPDVENTHTHQIVSQPAGVVVAYLPWNFPLLCLGFKIGPALAAGCSIIVKPSSSSPVSAYLFGEICHEIGFPAGVINILGGSKEVASSLSASNIPRVVTMIGSSQVGRTVINQSSTSIKRYNLELGGNAPFIVFPDADIDQAVSDLAALKFGNCGQICVTPNRVFVHADIVDTFILKLTEKAKSIKIGFGRNENPNMGPLISNQSRERIHKLIQKTVNEGAELVYGGEYPKNKSKGFFYMPTILRNITKNMAIFNDEIFGPVVPILTFTEVDEVIELSNDTEYGLASYLYTNNIDRIQLISESLEFGEVMVNGFKWSIYLPHMGIKESGVGVDCSWLALEPYMVKKRITVKKR